MQKLDDGGDTGHHDGEGGNARHKMWLTVLMFCILQIIFLIVLYVLTAVKG